MKCRICKGSLKSLGTVPFDRNNANVPIINDKPMEYHLCEGCGAISCQEMLDWTPEMLGEHIYNAEYIKYDPDYLDARPKNYAISLGNSFKRKGLKHLDYGSGMGIMSKELVEKYSWDSTSYDPYSHNIKPTEKYNLISAIEVFEHSLDVSETVKDIKKYMARDSAILFSTLTPPPNVDISWWYIGARNGHINIQSIKSLTLIAKANNLFFHSINEGMHVMQTSRSVFKGLLK